MFILWFLRKYTHPENIPITIYGTFKVHEGDIAIINHPSGETELGQVTTVSPNDPPTVVIQLFRRPK